MRSMSAAEAVQRFPEALDTAKREPVVIRERGEDVAVLISPAEYDKLRGLRAKAFMDICDRVAAKATARGLTDEMFDELMRDVS